MVFTRSSLLGVIACPGAEKITEEIISDLKSIYLKYYKKTADSLVSRYGYSREEVIRNINFVNELTSRKGQRPKDVAKYRAPNYKIPMKFTRFANGEVKSEIQMSIRDMDIYIVQDPGNHYPMDINQDGNEVSMSVNDHLMVMFTTIDAVIGAGARSVTVVAPLFPYSRQHKKKGREALTASWFGRTCEQMGVSRIITLDIHSKAIEMTFQSLHLENLHASYQIIRELSELADLESDDLVVVSPDTGAVDRNKFFAGTLNKPLAMIYKERDYSKVSSNAKANNITNMKMLGDVKGKTVFMADDMLGTGGTLIKAMEMLKKEGAEKIICAVSLPLFTGDAVENFEEAYQKGLFDRIIGTNAVYHTAVGLGREWYVSACISELFARTISRVHHGNSLSSLLDNTKIINRHLGPS
ncbi:MAG: ribose-phosphate diphosphokinase [Spirochaetales bacterium]|uniref:ribose-phosphate diphosphokinase n=1 Tax=Candidatus Thalassospirochaeta sargassi TaxID=3119039 RepID=A0AAJ1MKV2_9SPIO|nr:ribose-phosphate diphosphokinase [Spirochaetales bacterium]